MDHEESLALKYRPRTFDDIVGQPEVRGVLKPMVARDTVPKALLFQGRTGTGKTSTARVLAAALNCKRGDRPCGDCSSCRAVRDGRSLDVVEMDAASHGLVADIKALHEMVLYVTPGQKKVVLLDEAQSISRQGFNALLKLLEEPPPETHFILLTTEPSKILETVRFRCMPFTLKKISARVILRRLSFVCEQENVSVDENLLATLAERADGGMREALVSLDQVLRAGIDSVKAYLELFGEVDFAPALLTACVRGDRVTALSIIDEQLSLIGDASALVAQIVSSLTDVLALKAGGAINRRDQALRERQALAASVETEKAVKAMRMLWDLQTKVRLTLPVRTGVEMVVCLLTDVMKTNNSNGNGHRKMTVTEMKELLRAG